MSANTLRRAAKVAKIDFVEMEFSPFESSIEVSLLVQRDGLPALLLTLGRGFRVTAFSRPVRSSACAFSLTRHSAREL